MAKRRLKHPHTYLLRTCVRNGLIADEPTPPHSLIAYTTT